MGRRRIVDPLDAELGANGRAIRAPRHRPPRGQRTEAEPTPPAADEIPEPVAPAELALEDPGPTLMRRRRQPEPRRR
jgi:hypothetical protein